MSSIITTEDLKKITGYKQVGRIVTHLEKMNIPFNFVHGNIYTTQEAINASLGLHTKDEKPKNNIRLIKAG